MVQEWQPGPTNIPPSPDVAPRALPVSLMNLRSLAVPCGAAFTEKLS